MTPLAAAGWAARYPERDGVVERVSGSGNLQHPHVVEGALAGVELRVPPDHGELGIPDGVGVMAGGDVHRIAHGGDFPICAYRSAVCQRHVEDLLLGHPLGVHPALDDLDPIEIGAHWILHGAHQKRRRVARG
jgi:hypothetical protein